MKFRQYLKRTISFVLVATSLFAGGCATTRSYEQSKQPHWAIRYVADLPNGVLKFVDETVGQIDRLRDGDPSHLSEAYERHVPASVRAGLAVSTWYGAIDEADKEAVRRGWISEDDSIFGHHKRKPSGPAKYSHGWWLQEYTIERNGSRDAPAKEMDFDSWYEFMTEPRIIFDK